MNSHVKIKIGEVYSSSDPVVIETTLGSCVSVCLFDPVRKSGGMNHILLPGRATQGDFTMASRYGINAMEILINSLMKLGASRRKLVAKVFGGAKMFNQIENDFSPGLRNVQFILEFLDVERIPVVASDVGGEKARKIFFASNTGEVYLKRLSSILLDSLKEKERKYSDTVSREMQKKTKVTLF